jgi:RNA polymerase sigma factor (sigma-70 family)
VVEVPEDERVACASLEEIEAVYRRRLSEFRRVAAAISGDRDAATDVVQEAFVRAVRDRASFEGRGSLEAWLWRIVVNTSANHRRATVGFERVAGSVAEPHASNGSVPAEAGAVAVALAALPERQRLVLFLRYYADLEYSTIAETLGIRPGTVGATLHAARAALQKRLASAGAAA